MMSMGAFVVNKLVKQMIKKSIKVNSAKVLILGITFKENCPDTRNSKVFDIIRELKEFGCDVDVFDPLADKNEVTASIWIELNMRPETNRYKKIFRNDISSSA